MRLTYISWAESCSRSDHTARELGGRSYMVYLSRLGSRPSTILFKYIGQAIMTLRILRRERPDVIVVMTPPLFAALPAVAYAWWTGARLALDAHTAAFLHPLWHRLQWLQRWLCRRAVVTLVHNDHLADTVRAGGGAALVVPDVPIVFSKREAFPRTPKFSVAAVCSFNSDEPIREILAAAATLPDVQFFMTGDARHLSPHLAAQLPANVTLTGFLSIPAYGGLLSGADVVLALTTRDHTMLRAAYEAIYQGTPVIVSDWPLLRTAFFEGAIHVDNSGPAIARAIQTMRAAPAQFREGAERLCAMKRLQWEQTREAIIRCLSAGTSRIDATAASTAEGR